MLNKQQAAGSAAGERAAAVAATAAAVAVSGDGNDGGDGPLREGWTEVKDPQTGSTYYWNKVCLEYRFVVRSDLVSIALTVGSVYLSLSVVSWVRGSISLSVCRYVCHAIRMLVFPWHSIGGSID